MDSDVAWNLPGYGKKAPPGAPKKLEILRKKDHPRIMSISVETKPELILASLRADVSVADLCRRA